MKNQATLDIGLLIHQFLIWTKVSQAVLWGNLQQHHNLQKYADGYQHQLKTKP